MPPDITAGLIASACPLPPTGPPGAVRTSKLANPPGSSTLNAALFASLLTQSSPPNLKLAAPKTDAPPTVIGLAAKQQTSNNLKTMDTLPTLSFPAAGTAIKASELLPSSPTGHKAGADDKTATDASQNAANPTAATATTSNNAPNAALTIVPIAIPVQAVLLPVLTPAAAPAPTLSRASEYAAPQVSSLAAPQVSSVVASLAASALPEPFGNTLSSSAIPLPTLPAPNALPAPNVPFMLVGSTQPQGAPLTTPIPAFLLPVASLLPQSPQTPVSQAPQASQALAPQLPLPAGTPPTAGQVTAQGRPVPEETSLAASVPEPTKITAGSSQGLPHIAALGPVTLSRAVPIQPLSPAQAALLLPPFTPNQAIPNAASTAALGAFVQPATAAPPVVVPATLSSGPAKPLGKSVPTALKSPPTNADTYTRIAETRIAETGVGAKPMLLEAPAVATKSRVSGDLPEPNPGSRSIVPEKIGDTETVDAKAEAKAPTGVLEAEMPTAQAGPLTAVPSSRPLSASDQIKIVHQVADGVGAMPLPAKSDGVQQMSLQLHPKDWGSLQVSVSVTPAQETGAAKTVTAHIVAETPQVKAALQSQTGALHQALRASGLNLTHLTVSVKPAEETVKSAAQSTFAGFSGGQGQPNTGSSQAQPSHAAAGSQSAGTQLGTGTGSSQNGRQGQPPVFTSNTAQAEVEEIAPVPLPMRPSGRIDTHA